MPSIITSPAAPGINPNFDTTIRLRDPYVVAAGTTYYTTSLELMFMREDYSAAGAPLGHNAVPFVNNGTLWNRCLNDYLGTVIASQNFDHITNNGLIVSEAPTGQALTIWIYSLFEGLTNTGQILALSTKRGAFAIIDSGFGDIVNDGLIAARRDPAVPDGPNDFVYGALTITRYNGGRVINGASGEILAEGPWAEALRMDRGHIIAPGQQEHADIDNAGRIEAVSTLGARPSIGIEFTSLDLERANIVNSGTIRADIAISMGELGPSGAPQGRKLVTNLAGGVIDGAMSMSRYDEIVLNHGLIDGAVAMFEGDDLIVNKAQIFGSIDLGSGNDLYLGQAASAAVTLNGNAGMDLLIGGSAADSIDGGDGNDCIQGGGGADILVGGAGADRFVIAAASDSTAAASDTFRGFESGVDKIDLSALSPTSIGLSVSAGVTTLTAQTAGGTVVIHIEGTVTAADIVQTPLGTVLNGTADAEVLSAIGAVNELHGGGGKDLLVGSAGNDLLDGGTLADIMMGGLGDDIYVVEDPIYVLDENHVLDMDTDRVIELDGEGVDEVRVYVQYELPDAVENLVFLGAGGIRVEGNRLDNIMVGNAANNVMAGRDGNDVLVGRGGSDILEGGLGADRFAYFAVGDSTAAAFDNLYYFESGIDKIDVSALSVSSITWTQHTENTGISLVNYFMATVATADGPLTIRITADVLALNDFLYTPPEPDRQLIGTSGDDSLVGGGGNDSLYGGWGADLLDGAAGTDTITYADDSGGVFVNLSTGRAYGNAAEGDMLVNIENVVGTGFDDLLIGDGGANRLDGLGGDDTLIGSLGADQLIGGAGTDTASYEGEGAAVFINLRAGQGFGNAAQGDTYSGIENLIGSSAADFLIGDDGVNRIDGSGGDDILLGGLGGDVLVGGLGSDTASYEDNWGPVFVNLRAGVGSGNAAQGDVYQSIENLTGGLFNDFFIGDDFVNRIDGGGGDDILLGGLGGDLLIGGSGSNTASYEDNWGAVFVNLTTGQGFNNAAEGDSYTQIQNLQGGIFNDFFIGDASANRLAGGSGNDTLIGAGGADSFVFDTALGTGNVDTITDFVSGTDKIALDDAIFTGIGALGTLNPNAFFAGTAAHDADDRIVYDAATGNLFFDADGNGAGAAVLFANLSNHGALSVSDFMVI